MAVSALILKTKAIDFAEKMRIENFHASDDWLDCWKKRYNVSFKKISGEGNFNFNFMVPFYGWGSTASRLEPLRGGSLLRAPMK